MQELEALEPLVLWGSDFLALWLQTIRLPPPPPRTPSPSAPAGRLQMCRLQADPVTGTCHDPSLTILSALCMAAAQVRAEVERPVQRLMTYA